MSSNTSAMNQREPPAVTGNSVPLVTAATRWFACARGTPILRFEAGDSLPIVLLIAAATAYAFTTYTIVRGITGLYGISAWRAAVAGLIAVLITAVLFGSALPGGDYGWHPYISFRGAGGVGVEFGFRG